MDAVGKALFRTHSAPTPRRTRHRVPASYSLARRAPLPTRRDRYPRPHMHATRTSRAPHKHRPPPLCSRAPRHASHALEAAPPRVPWSALLEMRRRWVGWRRKVGIARMPLPLRHPAIEGLGPPGHSPPNVVRLHLPDLVGARFRVLKVDLARFRKEDL